MRTPTWLLILVALAGCSGGSIDVITPPDEPGDETDAAYDTSQLLRVEIEIDEDAWDTLRYQTRTLEDTLMQEDCQEQPFVSPFTWFEAGVTLDGQHLERVDVRKKGFLGSLSEERPALKLDLGEYDAEATFHGVRRLTLNNALSDPAIVRQCLTYAVFTEAGLPASRCSLAQVSVNGDDLGIYVNVEPIKRPMLERHFDGGGNLYEGTLSDFRVGWTGTIEKKNNEAEDDWADIDALVEAAGASDGHLEDALDQVLDLDAYYRFWAAEVLVMHNDGYAGNTNNFYLYADPDDGRFHFLPWGVDEALGAWADEGTTSIYASSVIPWRLYNHPDGRARYEDTLQQLLEDAWDEEAIHAQIDTMASLIEPELSVAEWSEVEEHIDGVRDLVEDRRPELEEVIEDGFPDWPWEPRDSYCMELGGAIEAVFETTWGTIETSDVFETGSLTMSLDFGDGEAWYNLEGGAVAGGYEGEAVAYLASWISPTEAMLVYLAMPEDELAPGFHELGMEHAFLLYIDTATMEDWEFLAYVVANLELTEAGTSSGAPFAGSLSGEFMFF